MFYNIIPNMLISKAQEAKQKILEEIRVLEIEKEQKLKGVHATPSPCVSAPTPQTPQSVSPSVPDPSKTSVPTTTKIEDSDDDGKACKGRSCLYQKKYRSGQHDLGPREKNVYPLLFAFAG